MKTGTLHKYIFTIALFFLSFTALASAPAEPLTSEESLIARAVKNYYIKALETRDFSLMRSVCLPGTALMSVNEKGGFNLTTLDKWSKRFDPKKPVFKSLDSCILKIDREGTAAQVKIQFIVNKKTEVTDFLHMLKVEGRWRIANIIDY